MSVRRYTRRFWHVVKLSHDGVSWSLPTSIVSSHRTVAAAQGVADTMTRRALTSAPGYWRGERYGVEYRGQP